MGIGDIVKAAIDSIAIPIGTVGKVVRTDSVMGWPVVYFPGVIGPHSEFAVPARNLESVECPAELRFALGV